MKIPEQLEVPIIGIITISLFILGIVMIYYAFWYPPETTYLKIPIILDNGLSTYTLAYLSVPCLFVSSCIIGLGISSITKSLRHRPKQ
jgi:hypothetical protein